jgi:glycosyltransferase involved in cell wall biosynthesis
LAKVLSKPLAEGVEIIVADWMSKDWPLQEWLPGKLDGIVPYNIVNIKDKNFSRGKGRNIAFEFAKGDKVLFLDTDMLVHNRSLLTYGSILVERGIACFPICYSYYDHQHIDGWWRTTGFGNMMVSREQLRKVGPWQVKKSWGGEDDHMFMKMARNFPISRKKVNGFYHQWHPEAERYFKKPGFFKRLFCR